MRNDVALGILSKYGCIPSPPTHGDKKKSQTSKLDLGNKLSYLEDRGFIVNDINAKSLQFQNDCTEYNHLVQQLTSKGKRRTI